MPVLPAREAIDSFHEVVNAAMFAASCAALRRYIMATYRLDSVVHHRAREIDAVEGLFQALYVELTFQGSSVGNSLMTGYKAYVGHCDPSINLERGTKVSLETPTSGPKVRVQEGRRIGVCKWQCLRSLPPGLVTREGLNQAS